METYFIPENCSAAETASIRAAASSQHITLDMCITIKGNYRIKIFRIQEVPVRNRYLIKGFYQRSPISHNQFSTIAVCNAIYLAKCISFQPFIFKGTDQFQHCLFPLTDYLNIKTLA